MRRASVVLFSLIVILVFLCVFFADLLPLPLDGYASQRFIIAGLLVLGGTVAGVVWVNQRDGGSCKHIWPVLLVAVSFLLLTLPFTDLPYAWVEPGMYAAFFLGFVVIGNVVASGGQLYRYITIFVYIAAIAALFYGSIALMIYAFALSDEVRDLSTFIPWGFVNIRYWSHITTWIMPLLALAPLVGPLRNQRLWHCCCAIAAALWWWITFLSTARGSMLGIAFGAFLAVLFIGRPTLPWLKVFLRYLAYGVLVWLFLSVLVPSLLVEEVYLRNLKLESSGRVPLFVEAWRMSLENFPFGLGPQSWLTHEIITEEYRQNSKFAHPHNMYLMWAAEYGWLIIAAISILAGQAIRLFWQKRVEVVAQKTTELVLPLAAFTASVSAALLHAGASAVFMAPGSMLVGFVVLCLFWSLISPPKILKRKNRRSKLLPVIATGVAIVLLGCAWLFEVAVYHGDMREDLQRHYDGTPYGSAPRFWHYGNFPRQR